MFSLQNWSFSRKLLFAFGMTVTVFITVAAIGISCLTTIQTAAYSVNLIVGQSFQVEEAAKAMLDLSGQVRGYLLTRDEDFAKGVAADYAVVKQRFAELETSMDRPEQREQLDAMIAGAEGYVREAGDPEIRLGRDPATRDQALAIISGGANKRWMNTFKAAVKSFTDKSVARRNGLMARRDGAIETAREMLLGGSIFAVLVAVGMALVLTRQMARPVVAMTSAMKRLAAGDLTINVTGAERRDEIGSMAQAVQVFRDNGLKLEASEAEAVRQRQAADLDRAANEAERAAFQRQQETVVAELAGGLDRLSRRDLTSRLDQAFPASYEKLRADFNQTATRLQDA